MKATALAMLMLAASAFAQDVQTFHVTEVRAIKGSPSCDKNGCMYPAWEVRGYTSKIAYRLSCDDYRDENGEVMYCVSLEAGADYDIKVYGPVVEFQPVRRGTLFMIEEAKER